jgi:hypothetical protein
MVGLGCLWFGLLLGLLVFLVELGSSYRLSRINIIHEFGTDMFEFTCISVDTRIVVFIDWLMIILIVIVH